MKAAHLILSILAVMSMPSVTAQTSPRLTLDQLIPGGENYISPKGLSDVQWDQEGNLSFYKQDTLYTLSPQGKQLSTLGRKEVEEQGLRPTHKETSADGKWTVRHEENRLWVDHCSTDQRHEVSAGTGADIVWGQAVHRNEFGIMGGTFWAPQGNLLAFYRMDESMVTDYPLVDTEHRVPEVKAIKYPMAGMESHQVTIGIYNPETDKIVYLETGAEGRRPTDPSLVTPDHYLTCVTWRPDGKELAVAELNRAQNLMELNLYDALTGKFIRTLFTEKHEKYVEPEHPLYFLPGSNDRFIWQSERDGWNHLYLYDLSEQGILTGKQLTHGEWMVTDMIGADPKGKKLFYMATEVSPLEDHLYCLDIKSGKSKRLTQEPGMHSILINKECTAFYDVVRSHTHPRLSQLVQIKNLRKKILHDAPDPYAGYAMPEITIGTIPAADGTTPLYYRVVKPTDFDPNHKYPVVVYLYNGPHAQMITEGWNYAVRGWDIHMANLGYVVFTIDGRGSERRGLAFEQAIWHRLGEIEGKDQMQGIEYLKTLPYVDASRIGIHGWSYGGFMTTYMMLNYPETFKVGVAGGAVLDWSRYEVMYGERYMGTPENNPEGYKSNCLLQQSERLTGKLLLIHDDQDPTVVPQMTYLFLKDAVTKGVHPDLFIYPGHGHNVRGKDRVHLHEKITQYFEDYLK